VFFVEDKTTFHLNVTLAELDTIRIRINSVITMILPDKSNQSVHVHVGAYPFVGISDTATVLSETPEDYMCLFSLSEFRNKPAESVLALGLTQGSRVIIVGPKEQPHTFKRKPIPAPIDL